MKSVMISIKPKYCALIASGKKTIEVSKTRPKLETPFKVYIYCTLQGMKEFFRNDLHGDSFAWRNEKWYERKGNVMGEFVCYEIEEFAADYRMDTEQTERIADLACVKMSELIEYGYYSQCLFAWHISDLKIYDKPKALSEFSRLQTTILGGQSKKIKRAPQSWCYVGSLEDEVEE